MSDTGLIEIDTPKLTYDLGRDGVWISDDTGSVAFLPRGIVIEAVRVLAEGGQNDE